MRESQSDLCAPFQARVDAKIALGGGVLILALWALSFGHSVAKADELPALGVTVQHAPAAISHGDERIVYTVNVSNTAAPSISPGSELICQGEPPLHSWFGNPSPSFTYKWLRNGVPIPGATEPTYTVVAADEGKPIQCAVTGTNMPEGGAPVSTVSASQPRVVVDPQPLNAPPRPGLSTDPYSRMEGSATSGGQITCRPPHHEEASNEWVGNSITWSFVLLRNGSPTGPPIETTATSSTYELQPADVTPPAYIQCEAIATDIEGNRSVTYSHPSPTSPSNASPYQGPVESDVPTVVSSKTAKGPLAVEVELPGGEETRFFEAQGTGWVCLGSPAAGSAHATVNCSTTEQVAPGASYPPLTIIAQAGADAPDAATARAVAEGGGASAPASASDEFIFGPLHPFGLSSLSAGVGNAEGNPYTRAGGHPFSATASFEFNFHRRIDNAVVPTEHVKHVNTHTPRGFVGNARAVPQLCERIDEVVANTCPPGSLVGGIDIYTFAIGSNPYPEDPADPNLPIYAIKPEYGTPAQFAFSLGVANTVYTLTPTLRADEAYAISLDAAPVPKLPDLLGARATLCGFGAKSKGSGPSGAAGVGAHFVGCKKPTDSGASKVPLLTNPTRCSGPVPTTRLEVDSWEHPGAFTGGSTTSPAITACEGVPFEPEIDLQPTSHRADSPTGMDVEITMPTDGLEEPQGIAPANLDRAVVTLPQGMGVNPSLASGLGACSEAEVKLGTNDEASCPESSKIGTVEIQTPLIEDPLLGNVYVARQGENPFGSLLGLYLVLSSKREGITIKVAGKVIPEPVTGQLVATFDENPEAPFSRLTMHLAGGSRAALINPPACGAYKFKSAFSPWSAADPANPTSEESRTLTSEYQVTEGPEGGACGDGALKPRLRAGLGDATAGSTSPFVLELSREDGSARFSALEIAMPPGVAAYLKGVPYCSDAALAAISEEEGTGLSQMEHPSCPAASQIGTVTTGAGAGPDPFYLETGRAYLAGPYGGAPLSLAIVSPALAGPFDLGSVVVRSALRVDPETAAVSVVSDPIPTILHGLLLDVRDIRVLIDRPHFVVAPTNCEPRSVGATVLSPSGERASTSDRFQVGSCAALRFEPKLRLRLTGGTKRNANPSLRATLTQRPGEANIGRVAVALPHSEFLDQGHIRTICTRVEFAAGQCPPGSIYGHARAVTPLLAEPLEGPVYLRSSTNPLPDLVMALHGQVDIDLIGRIDSLHGGIRTTFAQIPDAPVTKVNLTMRGGAKGLLVNSRDICSRPARSTVLMNGQNGKQHNTKPVLRATCRKHKRHAHRRHQ